MTPPAVGAHQRRGTDAEAGSGARPSRGVGLDRPYLAPALLTLAAAALRLSTLGAQSLWYDEAFTPVHVLRPSLGATLHGVVHTENTPPLWYVLEWLFTRVLGSGTVDLRLLSALAGTATVPVVWAIANELAGRRAALLAGALAAANPLFVWYSQEARAYGLLVLTTALAMWCFARALREPTARRLGLFGLSASLALLTHYFAVFLVAPMVLWLVLVSRRAPPRETDGSPLATNDHARRRPGVAGLLGLAAPIATGASLVPLALAQSGHGTQWIGRWALSSRLEAIPQYYLTGYSGAPLGHGVELLVALVALAGVAHALWRVLDRREEQGALLALALAACGVLAPIVPALAGADYLAPRNLVGAMMPVTALLGIVIAARRTGAAGLVLGGLLATAFLAVSVDVDFNSRLQRGDWSGMAQVLRRAPQPGSAGGACGPAGRRTTAAAPDVAAQRAIVTVELGSAPLEYYLGGLRVLPRQGKVAVREIDEVGYAPLRASAGRPPAPGFRPIERCNARGLIVYRFASPGPVTISGQALREQTIASAHAVALVPKES